MVGATSPTQVFSIVNTGNQLLAINSISITGANASSFSQSNTCQATLAPNASCSVSITFTPAAVGPLTANLQVADNAPGSPQTLALNGTGIAPAPAVTLSPSSLSSINQGSSSASQTLTVISSGNSTLHISSVSLLGANPSDFTFTNNCAAPLAPGSNCTVSVVFTPTAPGQRTANLSITDDAQGSPQSVVLSGTGIAVVPALSLSPPAPSFPATTQGVSSAPQTLTAVNTGNATLQISSISLSGLNASQFTASNNCSAALAPATSCSISLVFSPTASGQSAASLIITDDALGSPQTVGLSVNANPAFSVAAASGSSTSASVSAGQPAQYQLQLTPGAGFTGTVSFKLHRSAPRRCLPGARQRLARQWGGYNFHGYRYHQRFSPFAAVRAASHADRRTRPASPSARLNRSRLAPLLLRNSWSWYGPSRISTYRAQEPPRSPWHPLRGHSLYDARPFRAAEAAAWPSPPRPRQSSLPPALLQLRSRFPPRLPPANRSNCSPFSSPSPSSSANPRCVNLTSMDEQEFDALASSRGFRKWGEAPEGARSRRSATLTAWFFGMTPDDLRRQLLASHPEIPRGYNLADFQRLWLYLEMLTHDLNRTLKMLPGQLKDPRNTRLSPLLGAAFGVIEVGTQRLSVWEARLEIVRRAIDYLENR